MGYVPGAMRSALLLATLVLAVLLDAGCNRRIEPYDPDETVEQPDLSRIFPEGARIVAERERAGEGPPPSPQGGRGAPPVAAARAPIRGTLALASGREGSVPRGGVLFLVARSPRGGPPVAVKRVTSPAFPMEFVIGPDDRMIEAIPFEGPLLLSARVDADGNATSRQPGDLLGDAAAPVEPGATGVDIRIDQKL